MFVNKGQCESYSCLINMNKHKTHDNLYLLFFGFVYVVQYTTGIPFVNGLLLTDKSKLTFLRLWNLENLG